MADEANIFTKSWDFSFNGASGAPVGKRAGTELLGATVYELAPARRPSARWRATGSWRPAKSSRAPAGVRVPIASRTARTSRRAC
jgi:hypothetical protein